MRAAHCDTLVVYSVRAGSAGVALSASTTLAFVSDTRYEPYLTTVAADLHASRGAGSTGVGIRSVESMGGEDVQQSRALDLVP